MLFGICALKILIADLLAQRLHEVNIHTLNLTLTICLNIVSAIYQRDMRHIGPLKEIGNKMYIIEIINTHSSFIVLEHGSE